MWPDQNLRKTRPSFPDHHNSIVAIINSHYKTFVGHKQNDLSTVSVIWNASFVTILSLLSFIKLQILSFVLIRIIDGLTTRHFIQYNMHLLLKFQSNIGLGALGVARFGKFFPLKSVKFVSSLCKQYFPQGRWGARWGPRGSSSSSSPAFP